MLKRILIVDDEEFFMQGLAGSLHNNTAIVQTVRTGNAALLVG
jgi:YesN/AraC family two-component response regulator